MNRKPRQFGLVFQVPETTTVDGIMIGPRGELVPSFEGEPIRLSSAAVELSYARPKGRKVLLRATIDPQLPNIDPNAPLLTYQAVYAVDTNTRHVNGRPISVSCVVRLGRKQTPNGLELTEMPVAAIELHNVRGNPERVAWRLVCESLIANQDFRPDLRLGLLVDSSLNEIDEINGRTVAVVDDWMLPAGFTLLYASADSNTSTIGNRLIAASDKQATILLRRLQNQGSTQNLHVADETDAWTHIRNWVWNVDGHV